MNTQKSARLKFIAALVLWSTLGVVRRYIDFPSAMIAMVRGVLAVLTVMLVLFFAGKSLNWEGVKQQWQKLLLGGFLLGTNWALLFESYQHTAVGMAELFYFCNPLFLVLLAPFFLGEKTCIRQFVCLFFATLGMLLLSGAYKESIGTSDLLGIGLATTAALEVALLLIVNKKITGIGMWENTLLQLGGATLVMIPYLVFTGEFTKVIHYDGCSMILLAVVGILHTGLAYCLYYGSIPHISARELSFLGYLDPVLAVFWGWLFLNEILTPVQAVGGLLILGSLLVSEK